MNYKLLIYRLIIFTTCLSNSNFVMAQSLPELKEPITVEEVYDRFYNAIGLKTHPETSCFSKQSKSVTKQFNKINNTSLIKGIEVIDYKNQTIANIISSNILNETHISRHVKTLEKTFIFGENGEITENQSFLKLDDFKINFIKEPTDSSKAILLPSEVFNGEECYVTLIKTKTKILPTETIEDLYQFFSIKTGLKIGVKSIIKTTMEAILNKENPNFSRPGVVSIGTACTFFQNFQKVDNLILHHKVITTFETITKTEGSEIENTTSMEIKTEIKYNVDPEHFKNVTFKSPKEAIAEIPDDL